MANTHNTLTDLFADIADAIRGKTGGSASIKADEFPDAIDDISTGITPSGSVNITANGTYDVTEKASAVVNVPSDGITPSGTVNITENGTHDVTAYASANVQVTGLNARVFAATIASDVTANGYVTFLSANEYLKSIQSDSNAFVMMRYLGTKASTAMRHFWVSANFVLYHYGANASKGLTVRSTTSSANITYNTNGLTGTNYTGHLTITTDGTLRIYVDAATYPILAGDYQIIAGTIEML